MNKIKLVKSPVYNDSRGHFTELYRDTTLPKGVFGDILPPKNPFKQVNTSFSHKGVFRGLHYQENKPQAKFVSVISGRIMDIVVNLDHNAEDFGVVQMFQLEVGTQLYVPPTYAHGFYALEDTNLMYQCTDYYDPKSSKTLLLDSFNFRLGDEDIIISGQDKNGTKFNPNKTDWFQSDKEQEQEQEPYFDDDFLTE